MALAPRSVLDIGVGFGKYGVLLREYLEVWGKTSGYGKFSVRLDGVEVFPEYVTPLHKFIYSHIYTGDAQKVVARLKERYDLALFIDVLEHFTLREGEDFLRMLLTKVDGVLVSTPKYPGDQHATFGNQHETHRSRWTAEMLRRFGATLVLPDHESLIVYIGTPAAVGALRRALTKESLRRWLLPVLPLLRRIVRR